MNVPCNTRLTWRLLFIFTLASGAARASVSDSLKSIVDVGKEDTVQVNNLIALSKSLFDSSTDDAFKYGKRAEELARKLNYPRGVAYALKNIGIGFYNQAKYVEALQNWQRSLEVFDSIGDKKGVANMYSNMGAIYYNQGDDAKALELYLQSLKISEDIPDTLRIVTALMNIGAVYSHKKATQDKALDYYSRALPLSEKLGDKDAIGTCTVNLGEIYLDKGNDTLALDYFHQSLKAYDEDSENVPYSLNDIGKVYEQRGDYAMAIKYHQDAYDKARKSDLKMDMAQSLLGLGNSYLASGEVKIALAKFSEAESIAKEIGAIYELKDIYQGLSASYSRLDNFPNAFKYQSLLIAIKDTIYNIETDKKLSGLLFNFEIEKKQSQIDLLTKDKALQEADLKRQKLAKNASLAGLAGVFIIAFIIYRNYRQKVKTNKILDKQKDEIEHLLLNILPQEVAKELQTKGQATSRFYEHVSVLFTDFKSFTKIAEGLTPNELVAELNDFFMAFDEIIEKHHLEKIKTIGDAYMCAGGIPSAHPDHPFQIVKAGLEMQQYINLKNQHKRELGQAEWGLRVGIHTGPVTAGVVGKKKYAYDIWGDTVNIASRMESSGEVGKVNISGTTYELIKHQFECTYRGKIEAKNKGVIDMYFVQNGALPTQN